MILRMLPLRTTHAARLCWIAIARPRTRYTATSRVAERRDAATQPPRTALTMNDSMIPSTTNTIISSMNVNPAS